MDDSGTTDGHDAGGPTRSVLHAATYLGDNTVPLLDGICRHLTGMLGRPVVHHTPHERSSNHAVAGAGEVDLLWACGKLTVDMIGNGALNVDIVAAPVFAGETRARYRSVFITRADGGPDTLEAALLGRVAVNEAASWSGHHGLRRHLAHRAGSEPTHGPWFAAEIVTGSHRASALAVLAGDADIAGLDHTVWDDLVRHDPTGLADLRVIARTDDWPAPPFSLSRSLSADVRQALVVALTSLQPGQVTGLEGIVATDARPYEFMEGP